MGILIYVKLLGYREVILKMMYRNSLVRKKQRQHSLVRLEIFLATRRTTKVFIVKEKKKDILLFFLFFFSNYCLLMTSMAHLKLGSVW